MNRTRTRLTEQCKRNCDIQLIIAPIGRVITDNLVQRRLHDAYKSHADNRALICTNIDVSAPGSNSFRC